MPPAALGSRQVGQGRCLMKLARCEYFDTGVFWAVVDVAQNQVTPICGEFKDWAPAVAAGRGISSVRFAGPSLPLSKVRLLPPIEPVNRVVVAGANYAKHLVEFGLQAPAQPVAFLKAYGDRKSTRLNSSH